MRAKKKIKKNKARKNRYKPSKSNPPQGLIAPVCSDDQKPSTQIFGPLILLTLVIFVLTANSMDIFVYYLVLGIGFGLLFAYLVIKAVLRLMKRWRN